MSISTRNHVAQCMLEGNQCAAAKLTAPVELARVAKCMLEATLVYIKLTARPLNLQNR